MVSKELSILKINLLIERIDELQGLERESVQFKKWIRDTQVALEYIFGESSRHINDFNQIKYLLIVNSNRTPEYELEQRYLKSLENARHVLISMLEEIHEYWDDGDEMNLSNQDFEVGTGVLPLGSNKIFIIHGHDTGSKETVARFISQIGLKPIILHEQANQGRTIIEKFEDHSIAGYAIALITPDDTGASIKELENVRQRARQNVIFEFGYFIGKLGRQRVCGLVKGDIETPSDYSGVLYIPLDESGSWRFLLIKELKSAGYDVDANKAI